MAHPVVHFEIGCKDKEATSAFYANVFGWTIDPGPMGIIDTGSTEGIAGHIAALGHEPHQFTHFYIQTDDVQPPASTNRSRRRQNPRPARPHPHRHLRLVHRPRRQHRRPLETHHLIPWS